MAVAHSLLPHPQGYNTEFQAAPSTLPPPPHTHTQPQGCSTLPPTHTHTTPGLQHPPPPHTHAQPQGCSTEALASTKTEYEAFLGNPAHLGEVRQALKVGGGRGQPHKPRRSAPGIEGGGGGKGGQPGIEGGGWGEQPQPIVAGVEGGVWVGGRGGARGVCVCVCCPGPADCSPPPTPPPPPSELPVDTLRPADCSPPPLPLPPSPLRAPC